MRCVVDRRTVIFGNHLAGFCSMRIELLGWQPNWHSIIHHYTCHWHSPGGDWRKAVERAREESKERGRMWNLWKWFLTISCRWRIGQKVKMINDEKLMRKMVSEKRIPMAKKRAIRFNAALHDCRWDTQHCGGCDRHEYNVETVVEVRRSCARLSFG